MIEHPVIGMECYALWPDTVCRARIVDRSCRGSRLQEWRCRLLDDDGMDRWSKPEELFATREEAERFVALRVLAE